MAKKPKPAAEEPQDPAEFDHAAAHLILGRFLDQDFDSVLGLFDQIGDPVVAAAVAIRVCQELDPSQIAVLLDLLEEEEDEDEDPESCPEGENPDPRPPGE